MRMLSAGTVLALMAMPATAAEPKRDLVVISVGDLLYSEPVAASADTGLDRVLALVGSGDVAIGNQEVPAFDIAAHGGSGSGNGILIGDPGLPRDERAMGIDMVSVANNHALDWGIEGLDASNAGLDAAGIVHAGSGPTLANARRAAVLDKPGIKVSLVAAASTFRPGSMAMDATDEHPPRAGISVLRVRTVEHVPAATMAHLAAAGAMRQDDGDLSLGDRRFRLGATSGFTYDINRFDRAQILTSIGEARKGGGLVVFTIHAHENVDGLVDETVSSPGDFLPPLFHDAIDAGADMVIGGGPHSLRGIEIYHGHPILYGMGAFFLRGNIVLGQEALTEDYGDPLKAVQTTARPGGRNPASWYDGMIAATRIRNGRPIEVRLYPLDLAADADDTHRGIPHLATPAVARRILANLQAASRPFGTRIVIQGAVGVIAL